MEAIVVLDGGRVAGIREIPKPSLRPGWVLVKVKAIAVNPTDYKHIDFGGADAGSRVGCDYAGIVEDVGAGVTKFQKGDRICGLVHGGDTSNHENGAFGECLIAKEAVAMRIPENLSFEAAATLGVSLVTVGQGLYKSLGLPLPDAPAKEKTFVLIYAASTATGLYGIQFAKASGLTVIATASPHNFDYLRSLGADTLFDYRSPTCAADIKSYTENKLRFAWDCMGTGAKVCAAAMSDAEEGTYGTINPADQALLKQTNPKVAGPLLTVGYEAFGEDWIWNGYRIPGKKDEVEFAAKFFDLSHRLLADETVRIINYKVNEPSPGLQGALQGLDELRANRVSGGKLVYTI